MHEGGVDDVDFTPRVPPKKTNALAPAKKSNVSASKKITEESFNFKETIEKYADKYENM